ncbi:Uncharacterised protein [Mycobacteroides abscessus subsp. abscessus]|nr:Uncharacterised protein [Mycobacteroides abscessus subsp. abscessus]
MQTLSDLKRKARIVHRCELCNRIIHPGETYRYQVNIFDGIYTWKCCAHCDVLMFDSVGR